MLGVVLNPGLRTTGDFERIAANVSEALLKREAGEVDTYSESPDMRVVRVTSACILVIAAGVAGLTAHTYKPVGAWNRKCVLLTTLAALSVAAAVVVVAL